VPRLIPQFARRALKVLARAKLARRVPRDRDGVLREIVAQQMEAWLRTGRSIEPLTLEFWNSLAAR
jgi:hypothetical protein